MWDEWDSYDWWRGIYTGENELGVTDNRVGTRVLTEIPQKEMIQNLYGEIGKTLEDNMILLEPNVQIKIWHLMAIGGNKEIYGKCVTEEEGGYIVIKDLLIPYQTVAKSAFNSYDEQMSKFLYELNFINNDPMKDENGKAQGEKRPQEEIDALKMSLNGHWHSHNSLSRTTKPSPSSTDTSDMRENRQERKYWIELISSFAGTSGRLMMDNPKIKRDVDVKIKWWSGIRDTLMEVEGRIFTEEYVYKKKEEKKKKKKSKGEKEQKKVNIPSTTALTKYDSALNRGLRTMHGAIAETNKTKEREELMSRWVPDVDYSGQEVFNNFDNDWVSLEWLSYDPIQLGEMYVDREVQEIISLAFQKVLDAEETLVIEIHPNNIISWVIYNVDGVYINDLLSRFKERHPEEYKTFEELMESYSLSEDATEYYQEEAAEGDEYMYFTPRTITWKKAVDLQYDSWNEEKPKEKETEDQKTINEILKEEVKRDLETGEW